MRSRERGACWAEIVYDDGFEESRWARYERRLKLDTRPFQSIQKTPPGSFPLRMGTDVRTGGEWERQAL